MSCAWGLANSALTHFFLKSHAETLSPGAKNPQGLHMLMGSFQHLPEPQLLPMLKEHVDSRILL